MGELGSEARNYHQEVGEFAKAQGIDVLFTLGVLSQSTSDAFVGDNETVSQHFSERTHLSEHLFSQLEKNHNNQESDINILVKGSRSAHMENVVEDIFNWHANRYEDSTCHAFEGNA